MSVAVRIQNIGKSYRLGETHSGSIRNLLNSMAARLIGRKKQRIPAAMHNRGQIDDEGAFRALDDITFDVLEGEVVGIVGRNGAGKSTLLKILSRVTPPTTGKVELYGRVASLLEVGTGFHPELTGRENAFVNGAILGMTRAEITRQFDAIVEFAGVEQFIDTPVKRYSSGMYTRLAFAVAAHLQPEILIVDEVLAVGDSEFQKKCIEKMDEVAEGGRTVLFVSHNLAAVRQITKRCAVLKHGRLAFVGRTEDALHLYCDAIQSTGEPHDVSKDPRPSFVRDLTHARFTTLGCRFESDRSTTITGTMDVETTCRELRFGVTFFRVGEGAVASSFSNPMHVEPGDSVPFTLRLPTKQLAPGEYACTVSIGAGDSVAAFVLYDAIIECLRFTVPEMDAAESTMRGWFSSGLGAVDLGHMSVDLTRRGGLIPNAPGRGSAAAAAAADLA
jgi:lipopolysaccharide transport system ATP-binding protein